MTRIDDVLVWKFKEINATPVDLDKGYLYKAGADYESIDWNCSLPKPTRQEMETATLEYEDHKSKTAYLEKRKYERQVQGINHEALLDALWESVVNNSHDKKLALKAKIDQINQDNPEPI